MLLLLLDAPLFKLLLLLPPAAYRPSPKRPSPSNVHRSSWIQRQVCNSKEDMTRPCPSQGPGPPRTTTLDRLHQAHHFARPSPLWPHPKLLPPGVAARPNSHHATGYPHLARCRQHTTQHPLTPRMAAASASTNKTKTHSAAEPGGLPWRSSCAYTGPITPSPPSGAPSSYVGASSTTTACSGGPTRRRRQTAHKTTRSGLPSSIQASTSPRIEVGALPASCRSSSNSNEPSE